MNLNSKFFFFLISVYNFYNCSAQRKTNQVPNCWSQGRCPLGDLINDNEVANKKDCLVLCQMQTSCSFFTYNKLRGLCQLFYRCNKTNIDECPGCWSGDKTCLQGSTSAATIPTTTTTTTRSTTPTSKTTIKQTTSSPSEVESDADSDVCFQHGECTNSFLLNGVSVDSIQECFSTCKSTSSCSWYTFYNKLKFCQIFRNCSILNLSSETCKNTNCISAPIGCNLPQCEVKGKCQGNTIQLIEASSADDCLNRCQDNPACKWFTFVKPNSPCILFRDCSVMNSSCASCSSGERRCFDLKRISLNDNDSIEDKPISGKGYVALLLGGKTDQDFHDDVEVFSPNGKCSHLLGKLPVTEIASPVLGILKNKIFVCGFDDSCWFYNSVQNTWAEIEGLSKDFTNSLAHLHHEKIYYVLKNTSVEEFFDSATKIWKPWNIQKPEYSLIKDGCMLSIGNKLFLMVSAKSRSGVFGNHREDLVYILNSYDVVDRSWKKHSGPSFKFESPKCIGLPNNKILVLAINSRSYQKAASVYDLESDSWEMIGYTSFTHLQSSLVQLGNRTFAIGGGSLKTFAVEEFNYENNSWTVHHFKPNIHRQNHAALSVPAEWFQHLPGGCSGVE